MFESQSFIIKWLKKYIKTGKLDGSSFCKQNIPIFVRPTHDSCFCVLSKVTIFTCCICRTVCDNYIGQERKCLWPCVEYRLASNGVIEANKLNTSISRSHSLYQCTCSLQTQGIRGEIVLYPAQNIFMKTGFILSRFLFGMITPERKDTLLVAL